MKTINFEFELNEFVMTPFDEKGIITMLGFDSDEQQYFVKTKFQSDWFKEKMLKHF